MISRDNSQVHLKRGMGAVRFKQSIPYILLSLPAMIYLAIFNYWPMFGIVLAFKDYKIAHGIFGSRWVGLKNFEYFFNSNDLVRVLRNTILYNLVFLLVIGLFFGMFFALILYEIRSKFFNKLYQTAMLLPFFLSYVIITAVSYMFLSPSSGFLNSALEFFWCKSC